MPRETGAWAANVPREAGGSAVRVPRLSGGAEGRDFRQSLPNVLAGC